MKDYQNVDKLDELVSYATSGVQPKEIPVSPNYEDGAAPLSTLPAKWWNYFINKFTENIAKASRDFADIYAEMNGVLGGSSPVLTPDGTAGQLQAAILNQINAAKQAMMSYSDVEDNAVRADFAAADVTVEDDANAYTDAQITAALADFERDGGVYLGSVEERADLPVTVADAATKFGRPIVVGDYATVRSDALYYEGITRYIAKELVTAPFNDTYLAYRDLAAPLATPHFLRIAFNTTKVPDFRTSFNLFHHWPLVPGKGTRYLEVNVVSDGSHTTQVVIQEWDDDARSNLVNEIVLWDATNGWQMDVRGGGQGFITLYSEDVGGGRIWLPAALNSVSHANWTAYQVGDFTEDDITVQQSEISWVYDFTISANTGGGTGPSLDIDNVYPIGSIYISTSAVNPGTFWPGTFWEAYGQGRVLVGVGAGTDSRNETKTFVAGEQAGEYKHVQTESQLFRHQHASVVRYGNAYPATVQIDSVYGPASQGPGATLGGIVEVGNTTAMGKSQAAPIEQPYLAVYMWHRKTPPNYLITVWDNT